MEVQTDNEENSSSNTLPEGPQLPSPSRAGSPVGPVSPISSPSGIHRLFSFKSGFEPLKLRLSLDLPGERAPFSAIETEKSIASPKALSNPPPNSSTWETFFHGWWTVELLAFVVSFASLMAIIVILRRYNGHPQPDWPHNITLNSVLSWFSTLFKASLLVPVAACFGQASWAHYHSGPRPLTDLAIYDSASRGPIGSLQLLWYFKAKYVASIGAIATVLALGLDPIIQQTVSINAHVVNSTEPATIGRAQSFLRYEHLSVPNAKGMEGYTDFPLPPTDMIAAMFDGIFSGASGPNTSSSSPNLSCPTGNCTFPPFQTLAVCSECENITNALHEKCDNREATVCDYSLPNGFNVRFYGPGFVATDGMSPLVGDQLYQSHPQTILNFTGIWSRFSATTDTAHFDTWGNTTKRDVTATQCSLYWCVNTMQAVVTNGQISDTKIDSWYNNKTTPVDRHDPSSYNMKLKPPSLNPNDSSFDFIFDIYASTALNLWLMERFSISTDLVNDSNTDHSCSTHLSVSKTDLQRLLLKTNITAMFEKLTASMTHNLRSSSLDSQRSFEGMGYVLGVGPANGTAYSLEVLVSVRWPWLTFPAALLLIALVFFFLTLLSTSRHQLEVWKLSPFPLIFNRVDESQPLPQSEMLPVVQSIKIPDMERKAAGISARLEKWDVGPRLTSSNDHLHHMPLQEEPNS